MSPYLGKPLRVRGMSPYLGKSLRVRGMSPYLGKSMQVRGISPIWGLSMQVIGMCPNWGIVCGVRIMYRERMVIVNFLNYLIMGFVFGGIGTSIGGLISILIYKPSDKMVSGILSYAAGIMLAVTSFDLVPEAYKIGGFFIVTLGLAIGLMIVFCANDMIPVKKLNQYKGKKLNYIRMSLIIIISLSLHNFPEGVAVGSSYVYSDNLGIKIGILIAAHDIPEGISVGIPLIMAGVSPAMVLFLTLLTGVPTALGAAFGAVIGGISDYFTAFCLSTAASSMLYVSANELIPEAKILYSGKSSSIFLLLGFMSGCYLSFAV